MTWTKLSPQWARHDDGYETGSVDREYVYYSSDAHPKVLIWAEMGVDLSGLASIDECNALPMSQRLKRYVKYLSVSSARSDPPTSDLSPEDKRLIVDRVADGWRFLGSTVKIVD